MFKSEEANRSKGLKMGDPSDKSDPDYDNYGLRCSSDDTNSRPKGWQRGDVCPASWILVNASTKKKKEYRKKFDERNCHIQ